PSNGSTIRSCTSHVSVQTSSRNQRSWVTTRKAPALAAHRFFRWPASQVIASTSRWLVGSSSALMSQSCTRRVASATRRRCPPLEQAAGAFHARLPLGHVMSWRHSAHPDNASSDCYLTQE